MTAFILANPARAQSVLWVASNGSDANPCNQTAPCASFQGAINKGSVTQINCLTSGNYGTVTITASITIDCGTGNIGNVVVNTGNAITINVATAATVVLRHLSLSGLGTLNSIYGINTLGFPSGTLTVEDCMIHGFRSGSGIRFAPSGGRGLLQVSNSDLFDNSEGITVTPASGQIASVTLNRVELFGNQFEGLNLTGAGIVAGTMRDSVVGPNTQVGVNAQASQVFFTVEESSIEANLTFGILTNSAGSVINVGGSTIGGNGTGIAAPSGSIISFDNNQISTNGSDGTFTGTVGLQ
jgi:hypothetical protein